VPPEAQVVLLNELPDGARLVPSAPLGKWAMRPIRRLLSAIEPGTDVVLDLGRAPVSTPEHVAAVLWAEREALLNGIYLDVDAPDMISGELLDFAEAL